MRITPLDIRQKQFSLKFRGFDIHEVDQFLELVGEDMEALIRENNSLRDELARQEAQLQEFRDTERALKNTMMSAQQIVEDMKQNATREGELIVKEAERKGEAIIRRSQKKATEIEEHILEIKRRKWEFVERMRGFLHTFERLIDEEERDEGKWSLKRESAKAGEDYEPLAQLDESSEGLIVEEVQEALPIEGIKHDPSDSR